MQDELTTKQLVLNLEKTIGPGLIAVTAGLSSRQLGDVDLWIMEQKNLTSTQYGKLCFAWEILQKMININGAKPTKKWYVAPIIPLVNQGKTIFYSPAGAIGLKQYEAVQKTIGPL